MFKNRLSKYSKKLYFTNMNRVKKKILNEKYKISIIIPLYNAKEKEIKRAFESIQKQTLNFNEIEIVFVDDCSEITEGKNYVTQLKKSFSNIKSIFLTENKGSGNARNQGMKLASSNYIMFMDHDDYLVEDACEFLYETIINENVDIVGGNFNNNNMGKINWESKNVYSPIKIKSLSENMNLLLLPPSIWTKIYRKNFLINGNICFKDFKTGQDLIFYHECLINANGLFFIDKVVYNYEHRTSQEFGSISLDYSITNLNELLNVYEYMFNQLHVYNSDYSYIILDDQLNYWIKSRLLNSNLSFKEFLGLFENKKELCLEYDHYKKDENKKNRMLIENIVKNDYLTAYELYNNMKKQ
ncbi:MAG: glycosyltransferase family 2 protein [Methanosphaera sp.]|nr:glycosyltransferase family 2 protein [Methanosphaera sp.]